MRVFLVIVLAVGCSEGAERRAVESPTVTDETPEPEPPPLPLWIGVDYDVDESMSAEMDLDPERLREFRYERRGDIGDGTEEVTECTGTLPDTEHEALAEALDLPSWTEREAVFVTRQGRSGIGERWSAALYETDEEGAERSSMPPNEAALEAMVPVVDRVMRAIGGAADDWAACSRRTER